MNERFVPAPSLSRAEMEALQREIAEVAVFADDFAFDPGRACAADESLAGADRAPLVAGVDQAFLDDGRAVSAVVVIRGGEVVERVHAVADVEIPYIPGLLSFREGGAILAALDAVEHDPDLLVFDGSGRIHFREAGLATHVGVTVDRPAVGVAKNLLCGRPRESTVDLPAGARVPIEADEEMTAPEGEVVGYAVQTRQYDSPNRHVNPLYVSPGHRVSAETAADLVLACAAGYKLPEPTRLADAYADEAKAEYA
ncbi:MAG: endonuclease V [Haloarculaceae archaeon]